MSTNLSQPNGYPIGGPGIDVVPYHATRLDYAKIASTYFSPARIDEMVNFVRFLGLEPGMKVLDVACGPGNIGYLAAEIVGAQNVWFWDLNEKMIEQARACVNF